MKTNTHEQSYTPNYTHINTLQHTHTHEHKHTNTLTHAHTHGLKYFLHNLIIWSSPIKFYKSERVVFSYFFEILL